MADEKKSALGSIVGTFKSELKQNVLDKLGPDLGSSIEKGLEAKVKGKSFKQTFSSEYKNNLSKSLKDRVFGQGIVGKSLRAGFEAKFGSNQDEQDDPVEDITDSLVDQQGVLVRIETLATNISDNVYNITAAWSKNAKTLEETRKLQEEQHKQEMMSAEEAALESKFSIEPLTKPTPTGKENEKSGSGASGLTGMLSGLLKSAGKLKSALGGILKSKKFLALAAVTIGAGAAAALINEDGTSTDKSGPQTNQDGTQPIEKVEPVRVEPRITQPNVGENNSETEKLLRSSKTAEMATQVSKPSVSTTPQQATNTPSSQPSSDSDVQKLKDYFQRPENAADGAMVSELSQKEQTIEDAIKQTKSLASKVESPTEKAKYDLIIKNQLEPSLQLVKNQKQEIINRAERSINPPQQANVGSSAPAPTQVQTQPTTSASITPNGSTTGDSSGSGASGSSGPTMVDNAPQSGSEASGYSGPTMVDNAPSSGSNLAASSEAVESSSTASKQPKVVNVDNSTSTTSSQADKTRSKIMSPVANRGSLDKMSFSGAY